MEAAAYGDCGAYHGHVLHFRQGVAHELSCCGCPAAVLKYAYMASAEILGCEMVQEVVHSGKHGTVVGDGAEREAT